MHLHKPQQNNDPGLLSSRNVTITDVALEAGVSVTTISRYLNDRDPISQHTRQKIQDAMRRLGYRPNLVARSLRARRTNLVALVLPTLCDPYYAELLNELQQVLTSRGMRSQIHNCCAEPELIPGQPDPIVEAILASRADGVILGAPLSFLPGFPYKEVPLITIAQPNKVEGIPNIKPDNTEAGLHAAHHFTHTKVKRAILLSPCGSANDPRRKGFNMGSHVSGLEIIDVEVDHTLPNLSQVIHEQLDRVWAEAPFQGVFATADFLATHAMTWAYANNIHLPDQLQLIGFDGSSASSSLLPQLSTFRQPFEQLSEIAVNVLLDMIEGHEPTEISQPCATFVPGKTTIPTDSEQPL